MAANLNQILISENYDLTKFLRRRLMQVRRSKKLILIGVVAVLVLAGGIVEVVMAQNEENTQVQTRQQALLQRVCEIYEENTGVAIDLQELENAFIEARKEMELEALKERMKKLVEEGRINEEQAEQYLEWWQSRPDVPVGPGLFPLGRFHRCR